MGHYRKSHFAPAFLFLAPERRRALQVLYAVCRVLDDAVDKGHENPEGFLAAWKEVFQGKKPEAVQPFGQKDLAGKFLNYAARFDIPLFALVDLIEKGVAMDLKPAPFQTPLDLENYFYGVAGTVGLACLPIFGVPWMDGKEFAIRLGITVQAINCIRDVGYDAKMRRIYIPLDHMEQFQYSPDSLLKLEENEQFKALIRYEAGVARSHYKRAQELLPPRWHNELLPARIMGKIYINLLEKIEKRGFPVLHSRIRLGIAGKLKATWEALRD